MSRYIDADKLLNTICDKGLDCDALMIAISEQPTADVRENIKGEWIEKNDVCRCSVCGKEALWSERIGCVRTDYCPNCGAQMMRGEA